MEVQSRVGCAMGGDFMTSGGEEQMFYWLHCDLYGGYVSFQSVTIPNPLYGIIILIVDSCLNEMSAV